MAGREHIVPLSRRDRKELARWLASTNGGLWLGDRLTVEAVVGGGILVRTLPYRYVRRAVPDGQH